MTDRRTGIERTSFLYSDDGGASFVDGGALPAPGSPSQGTPVVKYAGGSTFLYFSSMVASPEFRIAVVLHRSNDYGHTWNGPYFVTPTVIANHTASQPAVDIDPDTGRVALTWIVYPDAGGSEVNVTFSDDITSVQAPTWSPRKVLDDLEGSWLQGPTPRFAGNGSANFYVVWSGLDIGQPNMFVRSTDNGANFGTAVNIATASGVRAGLGSDSNLMWPSMAVDPASGNIYVVHATGWAELDGGEIRFQKSTDGGLTFSAPATLNARPLADRSQWFPSISFDASSGVLHVVYYDQGFDSSSDLTELTHVYSSDGGATWSNPRPLTERPFHAGYGNDESGAHLGSFIGSISQGGDLLAAWAATTSVGLTDGQPQSSMDVPDVFFRRIAPDAVPSIQLGVSTFTDTGAGTFGANGSIDPDESVALSMTLENYVTNPLSAATSTTITGKLATSTPGVTVTSATATYPDITAGGSASPVAPVAFTTSAAFVPGTDIEFLYTVTTSVGIITLRFTQATGSPSPTTFYSEDFESITPPALPSGWAAVHGGGSPEVPWTTASSFRGLTTKSAFHTSAVDGPTALESKRNERLVSPVIAIPPTAKTVLLEFDVEYSTYMYEHSANEVNDGMFVRIQDVTAGRTSRTVAVEAFADSFTVDHATSGRSLFYPATLLNDGAANYIPDFSAFGGDAQGKRHVALRLKGMAGSSVQLRFEYSQYSGGNCGATPPCGVGVDNITMKSLVSGVLQAPAGFSATASSISSIALAWGAVTGADHYEIARATGGAGYSALPDSAGASVNDTAVSVGMSYAYRVRTVNASFDVSEYSTADLATTMTYATDAEVALGLPIRAAHIVEARTAVNSVLAAAGQPAGVFADPALLNQPIRREHIDELRSALNAARQLLLVPVLSFTDPTLATGGLVRAIHLEEIIDGTK